MFFCVFYGEGFCVFFIGELFGAPSRFDVMLIDLCNDIFGLCSGEFGCGVGNSVLVNVRVNCIVDGVFASGSYSQSSPQVSAFVGGNASF